MAAQADDEVHIVIETENVIDAVRSRRLLWDPAHDQYTAKEARRRAWTDICRQLMPLFDTFDEQDRNDIERKVQQRWRTSRDCFVKARTARLSAAGRTRTSRRDKALRSYSHYERLSFLEETLRAPAAGAVSEGAGGGGTRRSRRARPSLGGDSPLETNDEHFFRSLAPMLSALDPSAKLRFRSSVLDVLRREYSASDHVELETYHHYVTVDERRPDIDDDDDEPPDKKYRPLALATPPSDAGDH